MRIQLQDAAFLAEACAVLGGGGGGDPQAALEVANAAISTTGPVDLVQATELDPEGCVLPWLYVGAPAVLQEKLWSGREAATLARELSNLVGRPIVGILCVEIGGQNGVLPLAWASSLGLPLVDADGMGRAFPLVTQTKMNVVGQPAGPIVVTDERENVIVVKPATNEWAETLVRAAATSLGGRAAAAPYPMIAGEVDEIAITGSVSRALRLGSALAEARGREPEALKKELGARTILSGRVIDLEHRFDGSHVQGAVTIGSPTHGVVRVEFRDEYLVAVLNGRVAALTPDSICLLDSISGKAIGTEAIRFGERVTVLAFPCDPVWRTPRGLDLVGPSAYGLRLDYTPVEDLTPDA